MAGINTADLELQNTQPDFDDKAIHSRSGSDKYIRPGSYIKMSDWAVNANSILNESYKSAGAGAYGSVMQNFFANIDRNGTALVPLNTMNVGYTFITRPRLNLTSGNIRQHPVLSTLDVIDPNSVSFMIRMLLDTRLSRGLKIRVNGKDRDEDHGLSDIAAAAASSSLLNVKNPFFTPLCNGLKGISGWPDVNLVEETFAEDFHSGDFTYLKGWDGNNRTQELSLEFRDIQGSIILATFYYWCVYMAMQAKGVVMAYPDDIWLQRLNYTVSIYRFVMDPSKSTILWWSKATGCFPKSAPVGALFNIDQGEVTISSATNFSIPFVANDIKYNDPHILGDFNTLVRRYCPEITTAPDVATSANHPLLDPYRNFSGIPYIDMSESVIHLKWKVPNRNLERAKTDKLIDGLMESIVKGTAKKGEAAANAAKADPTFRGYEDVKYGNLPPTPTRGYEDIKRGIY